MHRPIVAVLLSLTSLLWKRLKGLAYFHRFYPTLCCKEIQLSPKIRVGPLASGTVPHSELRLVYLLFIYLTSTFVYELRHGSTHNGRDATAERLVAGSADNFHYKVPYVDVFMASRPNSASYNNALWALHGLCLRASVLASRRKF